MRVKANLEIFQASVTRHLQGQHIFEGLVWCCTSQLRLVASANSLLIKLIALIWPFHHHDRQELEPKCRSKTYLSASFSLVYQCCSNVWVYKQMRGAEFQNTTEETRKFYYHHYISDCDRTSLEDLSPESRFVIWLSVITLFALDMQWSTQE